MRKKTATQPKTSKAGVQLRDLKARKNPSAGSLNTYFSKVQGEKQGGGRG
jgi:hypothetical protein